MNNVTKNKRNQINYKYSLKTNIKNIPSLFLYLLDT